MKHKNTQKKKKTGTKNNQEKKRLLRPGNFGGELLDKTRRPHEIKKVDMTELMERKLVWLDGAVDSVWKENSGKRSGFEVKVSC
jgi:hypothetical protein